MEHQIFEGETKNRIVLVDNIVINIIFSLLFIAFGAVWVLAAIFSYHPDVGWLHISSLFLRLVMILFGVGLLFFGLRALLINESIIIDKKIQSVTIKRNSFIEYLRFIKEIPFSDIIAIEIVRTTREAESGAIYDSWSIYFPTIKGESIRIYSADSKSDAERAAEQIRKVTDKGISYWYEKI